MQKNQDESPVNRLSRSDLGPSDISCLLFLNQMIPQKSVLCGPFGSQRQPNSEMPGMQVFGCFLIAVYEICSMEREKLFAWSTG